MTKFICKGECGEEYDENKKCIFKPKFNYANQGLKPIECCKNCYYFLEHEQKTEMSYFSSDLEFE